MGVEKVRLTGGEPLLRGGLLELIRDIRAMKVAFNQDGSAADGGGPPEIALTTNGHLLAEMAQDLQSAGLDRVTVSMDAVDPVTFEKIARVPRGFYRVLAGVRAASEAGLRPVKVNCVLIRGYNDDQIEEFAAFARRESVVLRFIEYMPLEESGSWNASSVVTESEIIERISRVMPLIQLQPNAKSETATRYGFLDGEGEIGVIAPVSRPFCKHCSRLRLTSDGKLRTCLFSQIDHDLQGRIRRGTSDEDLRKYIWSVVESKEQRHHIGEAGFLKPARSMVQIGG